MKKYVLGIFLSLTILVFASGCGKEDDIIGSWVDQNNPSYIYNFNDNNSFSYDFGKGYYKGTYSYNDGTLYLTIDGDTNAYEYSIKGDILTIKDSSERSITYKKK
jgi:hypothetical protein